MNFYVMHSVFVFVMGTATVKGITRTHMHTHGHACMHTCACAHTALDADICNFADYNILFTCNISLKEFVENYCLLPLVIEWFSQNVAY